MWTYLSLVVVLLVLDSAPGEPALTVIPTNKTLPETKLRAVAFLVCEIIADFTPDLDTVESRWQLPDGRRIYNGQPFDQYQMNQGPGLHSYENLLIVQNLIYTDANIYTCEVRDIRDSISPGPWISAQVHLQLLVELTTNFSEVVSCYNETKIELKCEMSLYLRPDDHLQWFRGGQLIANGTERYTIAYGDGNSELLGQFGGNRAGPSRVSTLTISEPQLADSGTYTCAIRDKNESENIQLTVQRAKLTQSTAQLMPSTYPSNSTSSPPPYGSKSLPTSAIIGAVAAVLMIIVVSLIVVLCIITSWRHKTSETNKNTLEEQHYDCILEKSTQCVIERSNPLSPIETSINTAYDVALDLGQVVGRSEEPIPSLPSIETDHNIAYDSGHDTEHGTQQLNAGDQTLSFKINMAYGAVQDFCVAT